MRKSAFFKRPQMQHILHMLWGPGGEGGGGTLAGSDYNETRERNLGKKHGLPFLQAETRAGNKG